MAVKHLVQHYQQIKKTIELIDKGDNSEAIRKITPKQAYNMRGVVHELEELGIQECLR